MGYNRAGLGGQNREGRAVPFVVERLPWGAGLRQALEGPVVVATFDDEDAARADAAAREREARRQVNPFRSVSPRLDELTSLDEGPLCDWMLDAGVNPPEPAEDGRRDWAWWWTLEAPGWDEVRTAEVWRALDRVVLFRVAPRRPARKAYVVLEVGWDWYDEPPAEAQAEGGFAVQAFASRERAEERRAELEGEARRRHGLTRDHEFTLARRTGDEGEFDGSNAPLYEVVEIDWEGPR
jgi:hypothetical protein